MGEYVLGTGQRELARLAFQQEVWGGVTARLLDRIGVGPGWRIADLGCGPGYLLGDWLARIGPIETGGELLLVDESERWNEHLRATLAERGATNVRCEQARVQDVELEPASYDLIFMRWVLSFLPEPAAVVARLAKALKPGGLFAVQDYNHEGVSLFPESEGFRAAIRAARALYAKTGGDTWLGARLPAVFAEAGLSTQSITPNVLAGGPSSPAFRWADLFFPAHVDGMVEQGVMTAAERDLFNTEWAERKADPNALFFSPIVVDGVGRKE